MEDHMGDDMGVLTFHSISVVPSQLDLGKM